MPKTVFVDPAAVRRREVLRIPDIPCNQYDTPLAEAAGQFPREDLLRMHRDMCIIRAFETMLDQIKKEGTYAGIAYNHKGPAHLSIGQESLAVGMSYALTVDDFCFGSHRSHGEILARGLRAIRQLPEDDLHDIMRDYAGGRILSVIEKDGKNSVRDLGDDYLLYGTLAEIFARETGWHNGLGGSMHAFFPAFGVYPNNAIVGGSADIAVGSALYKKVNQKNGIVIANIGDASVGCGPVWEAISFAAMDQYKTLWEEPYRGGPPIIFNFINNHYGMGGQTSGETMGYGQLARIGAGVNPEAMHSERIDGLNPLAVIDAMRRKREILETGGGPVLLDSVTYRYSGHSPSDASSYRTSEEAEAWLNVDGISSFAKELIAAKLATAADITADQNAAAALVEKAYRNAVEPTVSPYTNIETSCIIEKTLFSNQHRPTLDTRTPEVLMPLDENPSIKRIRKKARFGKDTHGKILSDMKAITYREALFESIIGRFYEDSTLCAWGEENRDWGGAFAVYRGLTESLPYHRLFNSPISEGAIAGAAVGYALSGGRALAEIMYCDFLGRAGDEVFNQLAKWQSMSAGVLEMPATIRVSVGSKYGAQHSQDWTSLCAHIPGLKVVFPVTPYDAKGMMNTALTGTDPVIFFESQRLYGMPEIFVESGVPEDYYEIPFGEPVRRQAGSDLTIATIGSTLYRALDAAAILESQYGLSVEVFDLRSLVPLNYEPLIESVKKTGHLLLASDACERGSFLHTVASQIQSLAFDSLDAPVTVVGARNWITPAAEQEDSFFPQPGWIVDAVHERMRPLSGHTVEQNWTDGEIIRRNRLGV